MEWAVGPSVSAYVFTSGLTIGGEQMLTGLAKNDVIDLRGQILVNGGVEFLARILEITPVRLTP